MFSFGCNKNTNENELLDCLSFIKPIENSSFLNISKANYDKLNKDYFCINSIDELATFFDDFEELKNQKLKTLNISFYENMQKYDEKYFENNSVILLNYHCYNTYLEVFISDINYHEYGMDITLTRKTIGGLADALDSRIFIIETNKAINKEINVITQSIYYYC